MNRIILSADLNYADYIYDFILSPMFIKIIVAIGVVIPFIVFVIRLKPEILIYIGEVVIFAVVSFVLSIILHGIETQIVILIITVINILIHMAIFQKN